MPTVERLRDRAVRRTERTVRTVGDELREARLAAGLSQQQVADAAQISRPHLSHIEAGEIRRVALLDIAAIGGVLGLDLSLRFYPAGEPLRDIGQARKLDLIGASVARPLVLRREVPLPRTPEQQELRAWDAVIQGTADRARVEVEMRIRDAQALERRLALKRRDDPVGRFLLVVADTDRNRRVLREHVALFADLPRLRPTRVLGMLAGGELPPTGIVLL